MAKEDFVLAVEFLGEAIEVINFCLLKIIILYLIELRTDGVVGGLVARLTSTVTMKETMCHSHSGSSSTTGRVGLCFTFLFVL